MTLRASKYLWIFGGNSVVAAIALLAPLLLHGQCQPLGSSKTQLATSTAGQPEFFDEPAFTVAGVADTTNLGGHGSGMTRRTSEGLTRGIVSLETDSRTSSQTGSSLAVSEESLHKAADKHPADFDANHRYGKFLVDHGRAAEALAYLQKASQLEPSDYGNGYDLALALLNTGDYKGARTQVRALLARKDQAELHHLLATIEEKSGNSLDAVREYQRAAELQPNEPNLFDWGAELLVHRAPEPAIEVFGKGNRLFPNSVRMLVGLGVAWYALGSYDKAAGHLCAASDLNPGDPAPYLFLGKALAVEPAASEGMTQRLARFVHLQPENAQANYFYALSLWKSRRGPDDSENLPQVEALLEKAVRLDSKLGPAYLQLGVLYSEQKDFSKTIAAYQKAIEASPEMEEAHYRLAQVYMQVGENRKAQEEITAYKRVSKKATNQAERERSEMRQFVYTLQTPTPESLH